jgi:aspartate/methionine/tyrosine aminotransferase
MPRLAGHVLSTPHSGIRRMADIARQAPDPILLVGGDPNFTTPQHIIDAAAEAARNGATGYTYGGGIAPLREAIGEKVRARNGLDAGFDQVCVTTGGCGGLFTSLLMLLDPGDEVLVPDPGWSNYPAMAHVLHATAVGYPLDPAAGFSLDPDRLAALVSERTRAIIVNSPGNPTGAVETRERLVAAAEIAERHDLWLISDECYDELIFEGEHLSTATVADPARVITIFTFSKSYAMTGWRIGYVVAPAQVSEQLALYQEPVVSCASTISQHAALAALQGPQACVGVMRDAYRARRDLVVEALSSEQVPHVVPHGSFFLMADISETGLASWDFCHRLLEEVGVAVVPGAAFGPGGEGFVRISLAAAAEGVAEGTGRLADFVARLRAGVTPATTASGRGRGRRAQPAPE